jgi:hypothetical protein
MVRDAVVVVSISLIVFERDKDGWIDLKVDGTT